MNRPKGRMLSSAASFWHFDESTPVFQGVPLGTLVHDPKETDADGNPKLVGYDFVDEQGEPWVIGATNAIQKSMNQEIEVNGKMIPVYLVSAPIYIRWAGKIPLKNGQDFNKFEIILLA